MLNRLAMTSDYASGKGDPEPYLRAIAEAGFCSVHWCHQWNTDFLYGDAEIEHIVRLMGELGLAMNDIHASHGEEKAWGSPVEYQRRAGVELVRNRIDMARRLACDVVILHLPACYHDAARWPATWDAVRRSLDELAPQSLARGVKIALENMPDDNFAAIEQVFGHTGPEALGLCYDSGHGCVAQSGLDRLEVHKARLISLHLHESDGKEDKHWPPMAAGGRVDWPRLARIVAASAYSKSVMSIESNMRNVDGMTETEFLAQCVAGGVRFAEMVAAARRERTAVP